MDAGEGVEFSGNEFSFVIWKFSELQQCMLCGIVMLSLPLGGL